MRCDTYMNLTNSPDENIVIRDGLKAGWPEFVSDFKHEDPARGR